MSENARPSDLSPKLVELLDEIDQEVRAVPMARALSRRNLSSRLAALAVEGLKHLLSGEGEQAARLFEAVVEEIRDHTLDLG